MTHKNIIFLPQQNTLCDNITIINTNMTSLAINFNNMKGYCYNLKRKAILLFFLKTEIKLFTIFGYQ